MITAAVRLAFLAVLCLASWALWLAIIALASFLVHEGGWATWLASIAFTLVAAVFMTALCVALFYSDDPKREGTEPEPLFTRSRSGHGRDDAA